MRNKGLEFKDLTSGTYLFGWAVSANGYQLCGHERYRPVLEDGEAEDIKPPWLISCGTETRSYRPLSSALIHRQFAGLKDEDINNEVIHFAKRFGLLGRSVWLGPAETRILGESVERWRREIHEMSLLLAIWDMVRKEDAGKLGQFFIWRGNDLRIGLKWERKEGKCKLSGWKIGKEVPVPEKGWNYRDVKLFDTTPVGDVLRSRWRMGDVIEPALYYVCREANQRLKETSPQVLPFRGSEVYLVPRTLLDAMWVMFLWEITGTTKAKMCSNKQCPNEGWFVQSRNDQDYCSGPCKQAAYRQRLVDGKRKGGKVT
jgi:hypothetical protein